MATTRTPGPCRGGPAPTLCTPRLTKHQALPHDSLQEPLQLLAVVAGVAARGLHHKVERRLLGVVVVVCIGVWVEWGASAGL